MKERKRIEKRFYQGWQVEVLLAAIVRIAASAWLKLWWRRLNNVLWRRRT